LDVNVLGIMLFVDRIIAAAKQNDQCTFARLTISTINCYLQHVKSARKVHSKQMLSNTPVECKAALEHTAALKPTDVFVT